MLVLHGGSDMRWKLLKILEFFIQDFETATLFKVLLFCFLLVSPFVCYGDEVFISGSKPWERPAEFPRVEHFLKSESYFDRALRGVRQPYPPSLMFLKDQGAWYTPFTRRGMTGPYDVRGWHRDIGGSHGAARRASGDSGENDIRPAE